MEDFSAENNRLIERFKNALQGSQADSWFDEDELIDIFDYAGDCGNDYLRAEALMWAARYFPDSVTLNERRAVFYADLLGDEAVREHARSIKHPSLLTEILSIKATVHDSEGALAQLERIFRENERIDDEETIQLVNFAADTHNLRWISDHLREIKKRVIYLPALLFELADAAIEKEEYEIARGALEELVNEMPFNADYWSRLSSSQLRLGRHSEALESAEMALAIDPDNIDAIKSKAEVLTATKDYDGLLRLTTQHPDKPEVLETYVDCMWPRISEPEIRASILSLLRDANDRGAMTPNLTSSMVMLSPDDSLQLLDAMWKEADLTAVELPDQIQSWLEWAQMMSQQGAYLGALRILETMWNNLEGKINPPRESVIQMLAMFSEMHLRLQMFSEAIVDIGKLVRLMDTVSPVGITIYVIALVKLRHVDEARRQIATFLANPTIGSQEEYMRSSARALDLGHIMTINWTFAFLRSLLVQLAPERVQAFDFEAFDPLFIWH